MSPEERKEKARFARIQRVYGLTKEQYYELLGTSCPICLREWGPDVLPVVDHDHKENRVRGILCRYCNHRRLGHHRDPDILDRMADYLRRAPKDLLMPRPSKKRRRKKKK